MRLGVFGGTFDPIHTAHLRVAEEVADALRLKQVLFVPAGRPPHRRQPHAAPEQRLAMVRLAVAGNPRFAVSDLEIRKSGPSYTVETLAELRRTHPRDRLFFLLGLDQLAELRHWHQPERLLELCHLVALSRPGQAEPKASVLLGPNGRRLPARAYTLVRVSALDISATAIRRLARKGASLRYLVPESVRAYLQRKMLYREP
jgi:nicotinate-nucleotide adenylyltransferase